MLIAFIHQQKAFLPQIRAYEQYFGERNIRTMELKPGKVAHCKADVYWYFMGLHTSWQKDSRGIIIHEYSSASIQPLAEIKNLIKRKINIKPDFRLFLSPPVMEKFQFSDEVPYGFMDVGIDEELLNQRNTDSEKLWDFVFSGNITPDMRFNRLLDQFTTGKLKERNILVICNQAQSHVVSYRRFKNIVFKGPLPQHQVYPLIRQARFAINYKPLKEPYLNQTSTKILEYSACRVPVITVKTPWTEKFEKESGSRHYYIKEDLSDLNWSDINAFEYRFPDLSAYTWEKQILKSGIWEFIQSKKKNQSGTWEESTCL